MALAGLSAVFLVEMLDNSILNLALPTIGRELQASTIALQWVTSSYAVVFGGLMLTFGALADRFGRRRMMLIGLVLLGAASMATAVVTTAEQLIVVRMLMGVAAAMTTPGSMALAFRLFEEESLRVRAITLISTVGLVGLALGPVLGGLVLTVAPWQMLLLVNAPIALLAIIGIRGGIAADDPAELHHDPLDMLGALLATTTIALALLAPTVFVEGGSGAWKSWAIAASAVIMAGLFVIRERSAEHPLLDLGVIARPSVASGLAFKTAAGLATAGLSYLVTLQLQLAWGWSPTQAALGMLPQVVVLLALGPFVNRLVQRVGISRAAWMGAVAVVAGLAVYGLLNGFGYVWIAIALALVAGGLRVAGVVSAVSVLNGLPDDRTSIGAALIDTTTEVANGVGIALAGTVLAALFSGSIATSGWSAQQAEQFESGVSVGGLLLTVVAGALVGFGFVRSRALSSAAARASL
ncbi:MFS transporter [Brachybacterium tyrofermentans]|uniref:MFS transporter n=1 Tax=Brachybacterium tyrofermentans TaxID=47848 RepID=UPI003FD68A36